MKKSYTTRQLRQLWETYHSQIHTSFSTPCDACPGDPCYVTSFLDWLDTQEKKTKQEKK